MTRRVVVAAVLLALAGCDGCQQNPLTETRAQPSVSPATLDFGVVDVAQITTSFFSITNQGDRDFDELSFRVSEDTDPAFTLLGSLPTRVRVGQTVDVRVQVRPEVEAVVEGLVTLRGRVAPESAEPPREQEFTVRLLATAENRGLPSLDVDPTEVDFGLVGAGDVSRRSLTIRNRGIRDLILDDVMLVVAEGSPFRCISCPVPDDQALRPQDTLSLDLAFNPGGIQDYEASLEIRSNDPNRRQVVVPLRGSGIVAPVAVVDLLDDVTRLEPQTTVRLDGSRSSSARGFLQTYAWSLSYRPPGSVTVLRSQGIGRPSAVDLAVACPDPASVPPEDPCSTRVDVLADVAGTYEVSLVVVDSSGVRSAPASVRFRAVPKEQLHVQLVWDHPTADLDLHYMLGNGPPFNHATDCYFSNRFPSWFGADAQDARNPRLDVDDQGGFGPENVNVAEPSPGLYRVAVHYWNARTQGDASTLATVRIYVRGQLALEQGQFFSRDQQMWQVAEVDWPVDPDATPTLNLLGNVSPYPRPF
jgi:hypothetical protein